MKPYIGDDLMAQRIKRATLKYLRECYDPQDPEWVGKAKYRLLEEGEWVHVVVPVLSAKQFTDLFSHYYGREEDLPGGWVLDTIRDIPVPNPLKKDPGAVTRIAAQAILTMQEMGSKAEYEGYVYDEDYWETIVEKALTSAEFRELKFYWDVTGKVPDEFTLQALNLASEKYYGRS